MILFGPEVGYRHEMTLYSQRNLEEELSDSLLIGGDQYYIYEDSSSVLRPWLQVGFYRSFYTASELMFNQYMSSAIVEDEWNYKDIKQK